MWYDVLCWYVGRYVESLEVAEDLVQDVFSRFLDASSAETPPLHHFLTFRLYLSVRVRRR